MQIQGLLFYFNHHEMLLDVVLAYNSDIKYSRCLLLNYYISMHLTSIKLIIDQRPVSAFHQLYIIGHTSQINQTFYKII